MQDLQEVRTVEITVDDTGKVWINIDGQCMLRVGHARTVTMDDPLRGQDLVWGED